MDIKEVEAIYPISPLQEALLAERRSGGRGGRWSTAACELRGSLSIPLLEESLRRVVGHYPVLRTLFLTRRLERPLQVVRRQAAPTLEVHDWRGLPAEQREGELQRFFAAERQRRVDASQAPLVRMTLCRVSDDTHHAALAYDPVLLDDRSARRVLDDVLTCYGALADGRPTALATVRPFTEHLAWLKRQDRAAAESFWRGALEGRSGPTSLAIERGAADAHDRAPEQGRREVSLSVADTAKVLAMTEQCRISVTTVVHGAWALLLGHYADTDDVVLGVKLPGRVGAPAEGEAMVGRFATTLPLRVRIDGRRPVLSWLQDLEATWLRIQEHQHVSLTQIRGWLGVPTDQPLFESAVAWEERSQPEAARQVSSIHVGDVKASPTGDCAFNLAAGLTEGRLSLCALYDARRVDADAAGRLLDAVKALVEGIAVDPARRLSAVPLLHEATARQLLDEWNGPQPGYRESPTIHELFEAQVLRTPDITAVEYRDRSLTYRELNRRANQLAHHLRSLGVGPEVIVANCIERSIEMVVGILGVLKAGGAYVPMDPSYPFERLAFMLEDARAPVLLTLERHRDDLPDHRGCVVCLDTDADAIAQQRDDNPASGVTGQNLSYVIYTSGSTGKPKGVMVHHRGVCNSSEYYAKIIGMVPGSRMLQITSVGFDMCVFDVVPAMVSGLTLVLADPDPPLGADLLRVLQDQRIEIISFPPSILATIPIVALPTLKFIGVAGEAVSAELVARWAPGRRFYNAYGPAEGSVWCAGNFIDGSRPPVFGRAIDNVKVYLVDTHYRLVPVGVPGELCIGGDVQVTRGYLRRPDLTADRFIPDPFSSTPGARLYRTGDLARYLPDGTMEFMGRTDHQVKIRGFRVELGEVETTLGHHPAVREAVVIAREDTPGDKRLVAYILPHQDKAPNASDLRAFVAEKLPENMVPSAFVVMTAFPLTPNGKVDRNALPVPDTARPDLQKKYVAPRTPVEEVMVEIWTSVLNLDEVGVEDNFFELGGHSLLATQIVSRIRDTFSTDLPLTMIFQAPTISELSTFIEKSIEGQTSK